MFVNKIWLSAFLLAGVFHLSAATGAFAQNGQAVATNETEDYLAADIGEDDYLNARPADSNDPIEGFNRGVFAFNKGLDTVVLRPISQVYKFIMPEFGQRRVTLFLHNINAPVVLINSILQGDPQNSFVTFWRFAINSSLGVFGLFDMATPLGVPARHDEDFGQTLAVWGVSDGPYIVLPLIGPSNLRDTAGLPVDIFANPVWYALKANENYKIAAARVIDTRTRFGKIIDDTYDSSLDPYATFRSLYLQRRKAMVMNSGADDLADIPPSLDISK